MSDGIGLAEALLGLEGFRVLQVHEMPDELVVTIELTAERVGCGRCGVRAEAHDRTDVHVRDLPCFGRAAWLVVSQASVAVPRRALRREDVGGALGGSRRKGGDHAPGWRGDVPSGR